MLTGRSVPIYLEHRQNVRLLRSLPPGAVDWSMLCPSTMTPESSELAGNSSRGNLVASAAILPLWRESWMNYIPFIGKILTTAMNASRYTTTLEQNAEFIASDLENPESHWRGTTVGIISPY